MHLFGILHLRRTTQVGPNRGLTATNTGVLPTTPAARWACRASTRPRPGRTRPWGLPAPPPSY